MAGANGISIDGVTNAVQDALFTAVGLGILGYIHLQVQRRDVAKQVGASVRAVSETVGGTIERLAGDR